MKRKLTCLLTILIILSTGLMGTVSANDNLALGKPTTAMSTHAQYPTENVVDGNYRSMWIRGNYGSTGEWVQVDLLETYVLTSIVLHTRLDAPGNDPTSQKYRTKVNIWLSNDPEFKTYDVITGLPDEDPGYAVPVSVKPPKKAYRYIRAVKTDAFIFTLAEIEAFGYPSADLGDAPPEYTDVAGSRYEFAIGLLGNLGIDLGMNEEVFGVNNLVTRAQAADMAAKTFMPESYTGSQASPFSDVNTETPYYESILKAYEAGYILGDGTENYHPEQYVTQQEFFIIMLRALGYGVRLNVASSYAMEVSELTRKLRLLNNVSVEEPVLNCGNAAIILKNALMAASMDFSEIGDTYWKYEETGIPVIESLYKIKLHDGVVTETRKFCLNGDTKAISNTVVVGGYEMIDADGKLDAYLGKKVTVAVPKDEHNKILWMLAHEDNREVQIAAKDIVNASMTDVEVRVTEDKAKYYKFSSGVDIIYNGAPYPGAKEADLMPQAGSLTLIDNNNDSVYDVVMVNSYEVYYVHGGYTDGSTVGFADEQNQLHTFDEDYLTMWNADGYIGMPSNLKNGTLVQVYRAKNSNESRIVLYSRSHFKGEISAYSDEDITIANNTYNFAGGYVATGGLTPKLNQSVEVYLDENGDVFWLRDNKAVNNSDWLVGFSADFMDNDALDCNLMFKIFTQNGIFITPAVADKLTVDGVRSTKVAFSDNLRTNQTYADYFRGKLLRYKLNEEGKLTELDSQNTTGSESGISFREDGYIASGLYSSSSQSFWNYQEFITMADSTAPVFMIPVVSTGNGGTAFTQDSGFDSLYQVDNLLSVAVEKGHQRQDLYMYMRDEQGFPVCFMKTKVYEQALTGTVETVTDGTAPFMVASSVAQVVDGYRIEGIDIQTGKDVSCFVEQGTKLVESGKIYAEQGGDQKDSASEWFSGNQRRISSIALNSATPEEKEKYISEILQIRLGDILRYEVVGGKARAVERVFAYEPQAGVPTQTGSVWLSVEGNYPDHILAYNRFQFARFGGLVENVSVFDINGLEERFVTSKFKNVYRADANSGKLMKESVSSLYGYLGEENRVMVYTNYTAPLTLIIYEY